MQPTPEIQAFIDRISALPAGPGVSLDGVLQPSLDEEAELRKLFAQDRQSTRLANPHVGLVDVFKAPDTIRTTRARVVQGPEDLVAKYVMPLSEENRKKEGAPCMVSDLEEFKKNWAIFTEGSLSQLLDWNNVVAAGGSVLACLAPLDEEHKKSKRAIRKYYHNKAYPTSDVDLFLWGLNNEQAEAKIKTIYEAVRDSVPWDVTCIRTKHTISIHSQYPYRSVQIVLRLYQSPAEILAGFDIDAPCCAYDGSRVWANPRSIVAMMRQCNTVDVTRRSPSYEVRLSKYSNRAFEVYVPTLVRGEIDPTIYERSIVKMEGLARLLVLEKLKDNDMRTTFLQGRRTLRGRPGGVSTYSRRNKRHYKGDLKTEVDLGLEMNDYDVVQLHIPYGPGWDARRIEKLVYQTDLGMNSTFNPKNKGRRLHRHPAFFGTIEECIEDCCENCPKPIDEDERKLQVDEDEKYISGRLKFIQENPGRQSMTGSFNPIDVGEWSEQVYTKPTEKFFTAIAAHDRAAVQKLLGTEGVDVNQRDHVGRTSLHVAIFAKAEEIACDLIDAGARITARVADGRTPLHLAARYSQITVIRKLFAQNEKNIKEEAKKQTNGDGSKDEAMDTKEGLERPSSEDDWSSHTDDDIEMVDAEDGDDEEDEEDEDGDEDGDEDSDGEPRRSSRKKAAADGEVQARTNAEAIAEDEENQPDIIDINIDDWDFGFPALCYAVLYGSSVTVEALLDAGADAKLATKPSMTWSLPTLHPLSMLILRGDDEEVCKIAERLLQAGATSSTANDEMRTIFHYALQAGRTRLVETILRCDPHAKTVIDFPSVQYQNVVFPIGSAIRKMEYASVAIMLAHGAKLEYDEADITRASEAAPPNVRRNMFGYQEVKNYLDLAYQPVEVALQYHSEIANLLITLGAPVNFPLKRSLYRYANDNERRSLKDWVDFAISSLHENIRKKKFEELIFVEKKDAEPEPEPEAAGWAGFIKKYDAGLTDPDREKWEFKNKEKAAKQDRDLRERMEDIKEFLIEIQQLLNQKHAKKWSDLYPDIPTAAIMEVRPYTLEDIMPKQSKDEEERLYVLVSAGWSDQNVPQHLHPQYDEVYEACYAGDNDKIQKMCLPVPGQESVPGALNPLNISVKLKDRKHSSEGYTPLFAAIAGRRWSTARLVLAIATAQYQPDNDAEKIKWDNDVDMDDDSDNDSCNSDGSDETVERQEVKFVDIATRPSAVQSDVHPKKLLQQLRVPFCKPPRTSEDRKHAGHVTLIQKAVVDNDLEAFVQTAKLYDSLPQPLTLGTAVLQTILEYDRPEILDEYLRRTGVGIDVGEAQKESGDTEPIQESTNDENRIYLGLNVHGKKRADLARKNDPNAGEAEEKEPPLVWRAAEQKAKEVVSYLASDRPLAAYRHYALNHTGAKAIWFKRIGTEEGGELEKRLPSWLGWTINTLGESPLTSAIIGGSVDVMKQIAKIQPKLFAQALQTNIKFIGLNPLLLFVRISKLFENRAPKVINDVVDFLLSKKVSPLEKDSVRGWNIYHFICAKNDIDLFEHLLQKLPRDVNETLLLQKSKIRHNTPLHVAIKNKFKTLVKMILEYSTETLLVPDIDGQTPLHCAVAGSYPTITKVILAYCPPEVIHVENGVGNTPLEIATLASLVKKVSNYRQSNIQSEIQPNRIPDSPRPLPIDFLDDIEFQLGVVREALDTMVDRGTVNQERKDQIKTEFRRWLEIMDKRVEKVKALREKKEQEEREEKEEQAKQNYVPGSYLYVKPDKFSTDGVDAEDVCELVLKFEKKHGSEPAQRRLVHLLDVQESIGAMLKQADPKREGREDQFELGSDRYYYHRRKEMEELEAEESPEQKLRKASRVIQNIQYFKDPI
ncbi:unnamed protein product [Cyclocybe aegerita]|uniref:Ankyrin repeat protein n=1 Tax=Cyclocybe aegerita TaxID=1973307 RepID=A0A8S0XZ23_CYCAE|nr:unnamed protein product [Cyclocybe aegerita]